MVARFVCITHSDPKRYPARHYVNGRPVTSDQYWDAFDLRWKSGRRYHHQQTEREEHGSSRSRRSTFRM